MYIYLSWSRHRVVHSLWCLAHTDDFCERKQLKSYQTRTKTSELPNIHETLRRFCLHAGSISVDQHGVFTFTVGYFWHLASCRPPVFAARPWGKLRVFKTLVSGDVDGIRTHTLIKTSVSTSICYLGFKNPKTHVLPQRRKWHRGSRRRFRRPPLQVYCCLEQEAGPPSGCRAFTHHTVPPHRHSWAFHSREVTGSAVGMSPGIKTILKTFKNKNPTWMYGWTFIWKGSVIKAAKLKCVWRLYGRQWGP